MTTDIFEFWSRIGAAEHIHPADREVFDRVPSHGFDVKALPGCFMGPLRTAPVVLLFLSPGLAKADEPTTSLIEWHARTRTGNEPLISKAMHASAYQWWTQRTKYFGEADEVASNIAVLNIGAYHSKTFDSHGLLAGLPSSRVSLDWAQDVLFPAAERGERVVICLRAARYWGLQCGMRYRGTLFAPNVTRGGHMHKAEQPLVVDAVKRFLKSATHRLLP